MELRVSTISVFALRLGLFSIPEKTFHPRGGRCVGASDASSNTNTNDRAEAGQEKEDRAQQPQTTAVDGVFTKIVEAEDKLDERAQAHLSQLPVAAAAELMSNVADNHRVRNASGYVVKAVRNMEADTASHSNNNDNVTGNNHHLDDDNDHNNAGNKDGLNEGQSETQDGNGQSRIEDPDGEWQGHGGGEHGGRQGHDEGPEWHDDGTGAAVDSAWLENCTGEVGDDSWQDDEGDWG